jgi:hypothetical protein
MMKSVTTLIAAGVVIVMTPFVVISYLGRNGGSAGDGSYSTPAIEDFLESNYVFASVESNRNAASSEFALVGDTSKQGGAFIGDAILKDGIVYAGAADGVVVHNLADGVTTLIPTAQPVTALAELGDQLLVGGDNLYTLTDEALTEECAPGDLSGDITVLHPYGINLLIGTGDGLYLYDFNRIRELASGFRVTAIASDPDGAWIGTAGDGLYRWDGERFSKRYIRRDSTLFDNITALAYGHQRLYLGADKGLFVFDGGSWRQYGLADGLPSELITAIDACGWVVRIGTANGPVTFYDDKFTLMPHMEGLAVTKFVGDGSRLVAATSHAGLIMKSGGLVTTLYNGETISPQTALDEGW